MLNVVDYKEVYRPQALVLVSHLQDHERSLSKDRPPASEVSSDQLDYLIAITEDDDSAFYLCLDGDVVAGLIIVFSESEPDGTKHLYEEYLSFGYVSDFIVHPDYQGKGISDLLLDRAKSFCRDKGLKHLKLSVLAGNQRARAFYEKSGFEELEVTYRLAT